MGIEKGETNNENRALDLPEAAHIPKTSTLAVFDAMKATLFLFPCLPNLMYADVTNWFQRSNFYFYFLILISFQIFLTF